MSTVVDRWFSDLDDQAPGTYYGGFKEARIQTAGAGERRLSHPTTGEWTGSTFPMGVSDYDRFFREAMATPADRYFINDPQQVWMTSRQNRAELGTAYTVFVGLMTLRPVSKLSVDVELNDIVSQTILSDQAQCPWRKIGDGFLDQLLSISESLDRETPEPRIYGSHRRIPDVNPASPNGFVVVPTYLGTMDVTGDAYHVWLIAGHACTDIPFLRVDDDATGDEGSDWLIPHHTNHDAAFGAPYCDFASATFGNMRRYTLLFGKVTDMFAEPDAMTDPDACASGHKQLTVAVEGVEDIGDGTGELMLDRLQQYKHWLINDVAHRGADCYQSGDWLENPEWDLFDGPVPIVDEDSFDAASAIGVLRLPAVTGSPADQAGYIGAAIIGAQAADRSSVRRWIAEWNRSCGVRFGITHLGQMRATMLHPTQAIKDAARLYTDVSEILRDSFGTDVQWPEQANRIPFKSDYEHATSVWKTTDTASADGSIAGYGRAIDGEVREYPFAPGITAAYHLARLESLVCAHPPRIVTFEDTIGPDALDDSLGYRDLGDYLRFRHFDAVSNSFSEIRLGQIVRHQVNAGARTVQVDVLDCDDLIDFDGPPLSTPEDGPPSDGSPGGGSPPMGAVYGPTEDITCP